MNIRLIAALSLLAPATLAQAGNVAAPILMPGPTTVAVPASLSSVIFADTGNINGGTGSLNSGSGSNGGNNSGDLKNK